MAYDGQTLRWIYDRTSGRCHICSKRLSIRNYGIHGARGAWHVDHSVARARGGTDRLNNLYAACIGCNLDKSFATTRAARARNGRSRAPLSRAARTEAKITNTVGGSLVGAALGGALAGPGGVLIGAFVGGLLGDSVDPDG